MIKCNYHCVFVYLPSLDLGMKQQILKAISLKKRFPIVEWLPNYSGGIFVQDLLAGITVGLTEIPQGIAYAVVAGIYYDHYLYLRFKL